jgi:hypothetical protein
MTPDRRLVSDINSSLYAVTHPRCQERVSVRCADPSRRRKIGIQFNVRGKYFTSEPGLKKSGRQNMLDSD